jgi:hypothetical protein
VQARRYHQPQAFRFSKIALFQGMEAIIDFKEQEALRGRYTTYTVDAGRN